MQPTRQHPVLPEQSVTRAQMATFLTRALGLDPIDPPPTTAEQRLDRAEAESLRLLNHLRTSLGLQPLERDPAMDGFARDWARHMRENGFGHSSGPWRENIVWWSDEQLTPEEAAAQHHRQWINSSGHYRNMTGDDWTNVGIGMYHDESGWWGVHEFR